METINEALSLLLDESGELWGIIGTTLRMSFTSTLLSCALGIPLGMLLGLYVFRGKGLVLRIVHTLMGLPPVLAGLLVFFLLSRSGPLGEYKLLYSVEAMVLAQVLLITPIAIGLAHATISARAPLMRETARGIGLSRTRELLYALYECRKQLFAVLFMGFGRAISEVGAAQLVGGNVQYKTRVMTTAIVLETNKGNFALAVALGFLLLLIAFCITSIGQWLLEGAHDSD